MKRKENMFSPIRITAVVLIGLGLAWISFWAVLAILDGFRAQEIRPYLRGGYRPYREILVIAICVAVFALMFFFNLRAKQKWLVTLVNLLVVIPLCNPITPLLAPLVIPSYEHAFTIKSEADFIQCAGDMVIDFTYFPQYDEFEEQDVRFVGKQTSYGLWFYQSITAIVEYDSPEQCEADYRAYIDSHSFLTEPVVDHSGYYLIAAPEFDCEGIFFKVVTQGEEDDFPHEIYLIGIDRPNATLYYLYLDDHDLDFIADPQAQDLQAEMAEQITDQFNFGK